MMYESRDREGNPTGEPFMVKTNAAADTAAHDASVKIQATLAAQPHVEPTYNEQGFCTNRPARVLVTVQEGGGFRIETWSDGTIIKTNLAPMKLQPLRPSGRPAGTIQVEPRHEIKEQWATVNPRLTNEGKVKP